MQGHPLYRVTRFERLADYTLKMWFDDGSSQVIDFFPILRGELFGPLRDPEVFARVRLDEEWGVLEWPNGADFDPATLHDWPVEGPRLAALARTWPEATSAEFGR